MFQFFNGIQSCLNPFHGFLFRNKSKIIGGNEHHQIKPDVRHIRIISHPAAFGNRRFFTELNGIKRKLMLTVNNLIKKLPSILGNRHQKFLIVDRKFFFRMHCRGITLQTID